MWLGSLASKLLFSRCAHCKIRSLVYSLPVVSFQAYPLPITKMQTCMAQQTCCKHLGRVVQPFLVVENGATTILSALVVSCGCPVLCLAAVLLQVNMITLRGALVKKVSDSTWQSCTSLSAPFQWLFSWLRMLWLSHHENPVWKAFLFLALWLSHMTVQFCTDKNK